MGSMKRGSGSATSQTSLGRGRLKPVQAFVGADILRSHLFLPVVLARFEVICNAAANGYYSCLLAGF